MGGWRRRSLLGAAGALLLAGCTIPGDNTRGTTMPAAQKQGDGRLRTDTEPLTKRFPALGAPTRVAWMSGTMSSSGAPGPTTYWIDAVVWLDATAAETLRATNPTATGVSPALVEGVRSQVPAGTLLTGDGLAAAFQSADWWPEAYLVEGQDVVVLIAKGQ